MIRVCVIGRDNVGWSIDKDRAHLLSFLKEIPEVEIVTSIWRADIFIFVWLEQVIRPQHMPVRFLRRFFNKKTVAWITNDVTQDGRFDQRSWPVDLFISPSTRTSTFLSDRSLPHVQIPFYVSVENYHRLSESKRDLAAKLGIDFSRIEGKFLIGSFQRDSLGNDLTIPKWQKNPDLLIDIIKLLPRERIVLVLAGPRRHYVMKRCATEEIPCVFVGDTSYHTREVDDMFANNLPETTINMLYNLIDLNLVTSKSEGGPKAVLEASLAHTLVMSTDVGNASEFLHPDLIYKAADDSAKKIRGFIENPDSAISYLEYNFSQANVAMERQNYQKRIATALLSI